MLPLHRSAEIFAQKDRFRFQHNPKSAFNPFGDFTAELENILTRRPAAVDQNKRMCRPNGRIARGEAFQSCSLNEPPGSELSAPGRQADRTPDWGEA